MRLPRFILTAFFAAALASVAAQSAGHDPAVINIEKAAGENLATYAFEQLKQDFPQHEIDTATPWSKSGEKFRYRGPSLKDVLAKHGIDTGISVEVTAFDNYITKITNEEIAAYAPIVAVERACTDKDRSGGACDPGKDFKPLSLEDGGPYYIVWPLDRLPKSYVPGRNSIWVWFAIKFRPAD
ncbi:hypothetical protein [Phyllobacterium brassicacearum]|uniref:hypothetical protein n=1 Tax=Phyllobacterium brassicacearum TaxID=314235 RepID=UPI0010E4D65F|nr:hypothetical protein [Phyllobacterium brassicacearum]TDQ28026.1 hypothetical protein DEV91_11179 [Phyllobacterium brassicacearum]